MHGNSIAMPPDYHNAPKNKDAIEPELIPTLRRFLPHLWPKNRTDLKIRIVLAAIFVLAAKATILTLPYIYRAIVDGMSGEFSGDGRSEIVFVILLLVGCYGLARFGQILFDNLRNFFFERAGQEATRDLASQVFTHLHTLSLRFHLSRRTGEVTKIIDRGTKSIDTMLYFLLFNIAPTAIELTAVLVIFGIEFGLTLVAVTLAVVIFYIVFTSKVTDWRNKLRAEMNNMDTRAIGRSVDALLNYETVKYFTAESRESDRYGKAMDEYANAAVKSENSLAYLNVGQSIITNGMLIGAMAYSVWGWSQGLYTPGDLVFINTLLMQLFRPLDFLGTVYRTIRQGVIDMDAMFRLIDTKPEIIDAPDAKALSVPRGEVRFENINFSFDDDRQILNNVSFSIGAGQTLAIVGPSGAGKSTIGKLLFRFYDPQSGRILIDDQDIVTCTQNSLRSAIGVVPQDTVLFNDSIGYNIGYGHENSDRNDIEKAAQGAAIAPFIESLTDGYDTQVGERGLKLSGGEKQRVAIARTLLKNPPLLILDEATSALDSRTEEDILETLRQLSRSRTTLVIAHRLSTITHADKIILLDKGHIAEQGSHKELLAMNGLYAQMWQRQAQDKDIDIESSSI